MGTPARRKPGLKRDTLGKLLSRVRAEVKSKSRYHRFKLPSYYHDLSGPLQQALRKELEQKQAAEARDRTFTFSAEQVGDLVIRFYAGAPVEPL